AAGRPAVGAGLRERGRRARPAEGNGRAVAAGDDAGLAAGRAVTGCGGRVRPRRGAEVPASGPVPALAARPRRELLHGGAAAVNVDVDGRVVAVSSIERVLWPETGTTNAELLEQYHTGASLCLPLLVA